MKVGEKRDGVISVSFAIGQDEQTQGAAGKKNGAQGKMKSVQMGAPMQQNPVLQKKEEALRKARKIVADVFETDNKVAFDMEKRRANIKTLKAESNAAATELRKIEDQKAAWKEEYGVADDSVEQKDLELLEKRQDSKVRGLGVFLTPEEEERLAQIDAKGLTEYQKRCLEVNEDAGTFRSIVESHKQQIQAENAAIRDTKIDMLAVPYEQGMGHAQDVAEDIKIAASKEAAFGMIGEVKDKIDEETKEAQEKAEERKEEKEEEEEKLKARADAKEEQEERIEARREEKAEREQNLERNRERLAEQKKEAESLREQVAEKAKTQAAEESASEKTEEESGDSSKDNAAKTEDTDEKQSYVITDLSRKQDTVQEDVKRTLNKIGLTGEDAKGIAVDELI